jgi:hypothetical protein
MDSCIPKEEEEEEEEEELKFEPIIVECTVVTNFKVNTNFTLKLCTDYGKAYYLH